MTDIYPTIKFFIDGEWTTGDPGTRFFDVVNPSDETILGRAPAANAATLASALAAARSGHTIWRNTNPTLRSELILRACRLLRERLDHVALVSAMELGTPLTDSRSYVLRAVELMEWDAAEGRRLYGRVVPSERGLRQMVVPEPVGIVAAFTPWNAPVLSPCRKIGSALSAGCAIILKAAEETPASAMAVVQAFADAGLPPGVIGLLYGNPELVSSTLIEAPDVRMVTFTGSVPVGKRLASLAAQQMKAILMELGGHAPVIVCEDADIEAAAARCTPAKFRNGGQACIAPTRFFIHDSVYRTFTEAMLERVRQLKVGSPLTPGVTVGPLVNARRLQNIEGLVQDARARGAKLLCGGERIGTSGFFYAPTVLADVPPSARVLHEEPFGPVACLSSYTDLDQALALANALPFGLAGYVFTRDAARADYLSRELQCGAVAINHLTVSTTGIPFGGIKDSGSGREGGTEGVRSYTVAKTITHLHT